MPIVGGLDIHRKQLTFDYLDTGTGEVKRGQIAPADRAHLRSWLVRFAGRDDVAFALEGCTGWRYVVEELAGAGVAAHVAEPVGFQNSAIGADLGFYAARWYSLMRPSRMGQRWIRF